MRFMLDELIWHPTKKKIQKRKRDGGEAKVEKKGIAIVEDAPLP